MRREEEARPKSASFNTFGPLKRKHQNKAKSLLSTAASNQRFSYAGTGAGMRASAHKAFINSLDQGGFSGDPGHQLAFMQSNYTIGSQNQAH